MEIGRSHLGRMIIMILLTILANQVHGSTQPVDVSIPDPSFHPRSSLDHLTFVGTPHHHFSPNIDPGEMDKATNYAWKDEVGKTSGEVVSVINQVAPSASILLKMMDMPPIVLQDKGYELAVLVFTDYTDIVTGVALSKKVT